MTTEIHSGRSGNWPVSLQYRLVALAWLLCVGSGAWAAPEEIQVYMDEMDAPGQFGLDVHVNDVPSSSVPPQYAGQLPSAHLFRVTPEFSWGWTPDIELGAYLLTTTDVQAGTQVDGEKFRIKYIAPRTPDQTWFWGGNFEIGRVSQLLDINPWNAELKGIIGDRIGRWTLAANLNYDWVVSGPVPEPATFELDSKIGYSIAAHTQIGIESYNGLGAANDPGSFGQFSQVTYAVIDTSVHGWDLNFGVGRGTTGVSDNWVVKAIIGVPFD